MRIHCREAFSLHHSDILKMRFLSGSHSMDAHGDLCHYGPASSQRTSCMIAKHTFLPYLSLTAPQSIELVN